MVFGQAHRLGMAQFDQCELGGDEEAVEHDQQQGRGQQGEVADHARPVSKAVEARVAPGSGMRLAECAWPRQPSGSSPMCGGNLGKRKPRV